MAEHIYRGASDEEKASQSGNRPKLAQADELATQGKLRSEIARALGVSVMTLHRWRKLSTAAPQHANGSSERDQAPQTRIAELQLENSRLRRLVTDLLLEKMSIEEASQDERSTRVGPLMRPSCQSRVAPFSSASLVSPFLHHRLPAARLPLLAKFVQRHHARMIASAL